MVNSTGTGGGLRRVGLGIGTSGLSLMLTMLPNFLLVPYFLRTWGTGLYDHWVTLNAWAAYLGLLELGGQNYTANLLAAHHARGDSDGFRLTLARGLGFSTALTLGAALLVGLAVLLFLNVPIPNRGRTLGERDAVLILLLSASYFLALPAGIYSGVYRAAGLFNRGGMVGNVMRTGHVGICVLLLIIGTGPVGYAAATLGIGVVIAGINCLCLWRWVPASRPLRPRWSHVREGAGFVPGAAQLWMISGASLIVVQGVLVILGNFGTGLAATYLTHRTLCSIPGYIGMLVQAPIIPEMTFLMAQKRHDELSRLSLISVRVICFVTGVVAMAVWLAAEPFYPFWTQRQLVLDPEVFLVMLVQGVLSAGWMTATWALQAANENRFLARWSVIRAVVTLGLALWWVRGEGILGVALAMLAGEVLFGLLVFPVHAARFFKTGVSRVYRSIGVSLAALIPLVGVALGCRSFLQGWWQAGIFVLVGGIPCLCILRALVGRDAFDAGVTSLFCRWSRRTGP